MGGADRGRHPGRRRLRPRHRRHAVYDSLLAKLIVYGSSRAQVLDRARTAVAGFVIEGPKCNLPFFAELLENDEYVSGFYDTGIVARMRG